MADLDELAGRLDHELPAVAWEEPGTLRARVRDRRRQRSLVLLVAVAVLVVAVGGGVFVTHGRPAPAGPPASASASPSQPAGDAVLPELALLTAEDVGPGYRVIHSEVMQRKEHLLAFGAILRCPAYEGLGTTAYSSYLGLRVTQIERDGQPGVFAETTRFASGIAPEVMNDIKRVIRACAGWESPDGTLDSPRAPGDWTATFDVLETGFAGDESTLFRLAFETVDEKGAVVAEERVVGAAVRVGDLVTVVQEERDDPARMRLIGQRAADRMCAVEQGC